MAASSKEGASARLGGSPGAAQFTILNGHQGALIDAAFSRSGHLLATEDWTNSVRVWNLDTGCVVQATDDDWRVVDVRIAEQGLEFSENGCILTSPTRSWSVATGLPAPRPAPVTNCRPGHSTPREGVAPKASARESLARHEKDRGLDPGAGAGGLTDSRTEYECVRVSDDRRLAVALQGWCPSGAGFVDFASQFGFRGPPPSVRRVVDHRLGRSLIPLHAHGRLPVSQASLSPDGCLLVLVGGGSARLWDLKTGRLRWVTPTTCQDGSIAFDPRGRWVVVGSMTGTMRLRDLSSGKVLRTRQNAPGWCSSLETSADGSRVVGRADASDGGSDWEWTLADDEIISPVRHWPRRRSPCGRFWLDGNVLRDANGQPGRHATVGRDWFSAAFSPHSRWLAIGSSDGDRTSVSFWNLRTLRCIRRVTLIAREYGRGNVLPVLGFLDDNRLQYVHGPMVGTYDVRDGRLTQTRMLHAQQSPLAFDARRGLLVTSDSTFRAYLHFVRPGKTVSLAELGGNREWVVLADGSWDASPQVRRLVRLRTRGGLKSATRYRHPGLLAELFYSNLSR